MSRSVFFENTDIYASDFQLLVKALMTQGVLLDDTGALEVSAAGNMDVAIAPGNIFIDGAALEISETESATIPTADGVLGQVHRIIARRNNTLNKISIEVISGTKAAEPTAPELANDGTFHDYSLATVTVPAGTTEITDDMIESDRGKTALCPTANARTGILATIAGLAEKADCLTLGDIKLTACSAAPDKWLICDGSAISRTTYADLFAAIGTTYGAGDESTTFNIPDLAGRVAIGKNSSHALGTKAGEETHTLTSSENGQHSHTNSLKYGQYGTNWSGGGEHADIAFTSQNYETSESNRNKCGNLQTATTTTSIVGGQAHNNMQPYQTLNYIIFAGV